MLIRKISNTLDSGFCVDCLEQALQAYGAPEIFNTDQGCQFTSEAFTGVLKAHSIAISTCEVVDADKRAHGEADGGTAYFEPDDLWPIGGFKCLHGHCADRHVRDLLSLFDIEVSAARMKPTIRVMAGELNRVVDAAERELAQSRRHYQRGGLIVIVVTDPGTRETHVQKITPPALVRALAGAATWERFNGRSEDWVRAEGIKPPSASALLHAGFPLLPQPLHAVALHGFAKDRYPTPSDDLTS